MPCGMNFQYQIDNIIEIQTNISYPILSSDNLQHSFHQQNYTKIYVQLYC